MTEEGHQTLWREPSRHAVVLIFQTWAHINRLFLCIQHFVSRLVKACLTKQITKFHILQYYKNKTGQKPVCIFHLAYRRHNSRSQSKQWPQVVANSVRPWLFLSERRPTYLSWNMLTGIVSISWWRHQMETFSALLAFVPPVNSPHKGHWRGTLMFSLICVWINGWVNIREAGDLRRYCAHYHVTVM